MSPEVTLYIPSGFLRPMQGSDITDHYVLGLNDSRVNQYLEVRHHLQTRESVSSFVRMNKDSPNMILWGFWYGDESQERLVGTVRLHGINNAEPYCCIGVCLFERTVWCKRLGSHVIRTVTEWAFRNLNLYAVRAGVYLENVGSQKAFLRAGYNFSHTSKIQFSIGQKAESINVYHATSAHFET